MISLSYIAALAQGYYCCRYILLISIMQVSVFTAVLVSTSYLVPRTAVWCVTGTAVLWIKSLSTTKRVPVHSALQLCTYTAVQQSSVASSSRRGVIASWMRDEAQQKSSLPVACIAIYWYLPVVVLTNLWQLTARSCRGINDIWIHSPQPRCACHQLQGILGTTNGVLDGIVTRDSSTMQEYL